MWLDEFTVAPHQRWWSVCLPRTLKDLGSTRQCKERGSTGILGQSHCLLFALRRGRTRTRTQTHERTPQHTHISYRAL